MGSHTAGVWIQVKKGHIFVICHSTKLRRVGRVGAEVKVIHELAIVHAGQEAWVRIHYTLFHNGKVNQNGPSSSTWEAQSRFS